MFALRRIAARAVAAPTLTPSIRTQSGAQQLSRNYSVALNKTLRPAQANSLYLSLQRRWASDEPAETRQEPEADGAERASATSRQVRPEAASGEVEKDPNSIFVANLYYEVNDTTLAEKFSEFGEVMTTRIMYDRRGLSRGFGWITFKDAASAQVAIQKMNGKLWEGRMIVVSEQEGRKRPATTANSLASRPRNPPSKTLFIGNLSFDMTDTDLNNLFAPIRGVVDVRVAIDRRSGQCRGFAHADFQDEASATEGMEMLRTKVMYGRPVRVDYSTTYTERPTPYGGNKNFSE